MRDTGGKRREGREGERRGGRVRGGEEEKSFTVVYRPGLSL